MEPGEHVRVPDPDSKGTIAAVYVGSGKAVQRFRQAAAQAARDALKKRRPEVAWKIVYRFVPNAETEALE